MEQTRGWTHSSLCRIRSSGGISTWTTWSLRWPRSPKRRPWKNFKGRCKNDSWAWAWGKLWRAQTNCVNVCYCADGLYRSRIFPGMLFSVRYNPIFLTFMGRGSRCYFPVFIQGANLSVGDLHFSQGDVSFPFRQLYVMLIPLHRVKWVLYYREERYGWLLSL